MLPDVNLQLFREFFRNVIETDAESLKEIVFGFWLNSVKNRCLDFNFFALAEQREDHRDSVPFVQP